ncbi:DUF624 domain-containing protein [Clostridium hydrogenum]|uniref:DUF624 domain-containing protein n=1 Tax=Clostridium hydrogenum TaxID=2855764 RepID=UPI001F1B0F47|nr:DUF624 domain-containing protein [Clostridium hydrogenum]
MKKEFYDRPFYIITNYIIGFFLGSIYLGICNILLLLYFVFITNSQNNLNLFLLFIFLIPLGPSLGALYSTNGKLLREKDIEFSSYFWNSYKNNFVSHLKPWLIELTTITLLLIDYYQIPQSGFRIVFAILLVIIFLLSLFTLAINSIFQLKLKDLFMVSLYYMIKKLPITILKIIIIGLAYALCKNIPIISLVFIPSILFFIFYYYDKIIFIELKNRSLSSSNN